MPQGANRLGAIGLVLLLCTVLMSGCLELTSGLDPGADDDSGSGSGADDEQPGSGSAGDGPDDANATDSDDDVSDATDDGSSADANTTETPDPAGNDTGSGGNNNSTSIPALPPQEWPDIDQASVRPGVQVRTGAGQCTSNFVYRSPINATLYLGLAAHCLYDDDGARYTEATVSTISGGMAWTGDVAFDSWRSLGFDPTAESTTIGDSVNHFDFALIEVPADAEDTVHPAVLHFGGPTRMGTPEDIRTYGRVTSFGQSGLRPIGGPGDHHEGVITGTSNSGWTIEVLTALPGVPGDSGSGLMTNDGVALGALSTISITPIPGKNGFSSLPKAMDHLEDDDFPIELQTWDWFDRNFL